jgi:hypothetical protein
LTLLKSANLNNFLRFVCLNLQSANFYFLTTDFCTQLDGIKIGNLKQQLDEQFFENLHPRR